MRSLREVLFAQRDALPAPHQMLGFSSDGGVMPPSVSPTTVLGLSAVWRSLDILSNGVSQLDWFERRGDLDLPASRLVKRLEPDRTRRESVTIIVNTLALYDVCYLLKSEETDAEGVPLNLYYLQPIQITPETVDTFTLGLPRNYWVLGKRVPRDRLVILHRSPQPGVWDNIGGLIALARAMFAAAISAENYASRYWQAGGAPTTVLETDAVLRGITAEQLQERWREGRQRGPDYAAVLEGGLKAKAFGADITQQAAVEARREQVADIGRFFGIPTSLLNAPRSDSETYHTEEMAGHHLVRWTLKNYINAIEDAISEQLPGNRRMLMNTYDLERGTQLAQAQAMQLATGNKPWLTQEEARDLWGLPPMEDPSELEPVVPPELTVAPAPATTPGAPT